MNVTLMLAGTIGTVVSIAAIYVFYELTVAYWAPDKARKRWLMLIDSPKLRYFAPSFRWLMPLFVLIIVLQLFVSVQMVLSTIAAT